MRLGAEVGWADGWPLGSADGCEDGSEVGCALCTMILVKTVLYARSPLPDRAAARTGLLLASAADWRMLVNLCDSTASFNRDNTDWCTAALNASTGSSDAILPEVAFMRYVDR